MATIMLLSSFLRNGRFSLDISKGDGHCLLYSIVTSWNKQRPNDTTLDLADLKQSILIEALKNINMYKEFLVCHDQKNFLFGISYYLHSQTKQFNNCFGDLIPLIIATTLQTGILILNEISPGICRLDYLHPITTACSEQFLVIHRCGDHFNGVVPLDCSNNTVTNSHVSSYLRALGNTTSLLMELSLILPFRQTFRSCCTEYSL